VFVTSVFVVLDRIREATSAEQSPTMHCAAKRRSIRCTAAPASSQSFTTALHPAGPVR